MFFSIMLKMLIYLEGTGFCRIFVSVKEDTKKRKLFFRASFCITINHIKTLALNS